MSIPEVGSKNRLLAFLARYLNKVDSLLVGGLLRVKGGADISGSVNITGSNTGTALRVSLGDPGVAPNSAYNNFVFQSNDSIGMSFLAPDTETTSIVFGSPSDSTGFAIYNDPSTSTGHLNVSQWPIVDATMKFSVVGGIFPPAFEALCIGPGAYVTKVNQPAFLFYVSSDQTLTANLWTTVDFDTEVFDNNNDFASDTFTAPVDGKYLFTAGVRIDGIDNAGTQYVRGRFRSIDQGLEYRVGIMDISDRARLYWAVGGSIVMDLLEGETADFQVVTRTGTSNVDAGTDPSTLRTSWFSGYLLG